MAQVETNEDLNEQLTFPIRRDTLKNNGEYDDETARINIKYPSKSF